jgi:hypothetical protein
MERTTATKENEMTDNEKLAWIVANWNIATDEQKAEAQMLTVTAAAERYTEIAVNRAMGFIFDYATGNFVEVR